jgi:hypothetical protein
MNLRVRSKAVCCWRAVPLLFAYTLEAPRPNYVDPFWKRLSLGKLRGVLPYGHQKSERGWPWRYGHLK